MTGEGAVLGDRGVTGVFAVGAVVAVTEVFAVGEPVAVGEPDSLGEGVGLAPVVVGVGVGDAVCAPTVIAGRGSARAGAPEFIAANPSEQVATPSVPDTAQAIADFDSGMLLPSSSSG